MFVITKNKTINITDIFPLRIKEKRGRYSVEVQFESDKRLTEKEKSYVAVAIQHLLEADKGVKFENNEG